MVTVNAITGEMTTDAPLGQRDAVTSYKAMNAAGFGRGLFKDYRANVGSAEKGGGLKLC